MILDDWKVGDPPSAKHLNQPLAAIRQLQELSGGPTGTSNLNFPRPILALTTTAGPRGSTLDPDFTDNRYWCAIALCRSGVSSGAFHSTLHVEARNRNLAYENPAKAPPDIVQATNIGEHDITTGTTPNRTGRGLRPGTPVLLFPVYQTSHSDEGGIEQPALAWVFCGPRRDVSLVKVTGSASGGGKYTGYVLGPPPSTVNIPATGNLSEAELSYNSETIRIVNTREVGASTHDLASSGFLPLIFVGVFLKVASDGVPVYAIDGAQQEDCT